MSKQYKLIRYPDPAERQMLMEIYKLPNLTQSIKDKIDCIFEQLLCPIVVETQPAQVFKASDFNDVSLPTSPDWVPTYS